MAIKHDTPLPPTPSSPPGTGSGGGFNWDPVSWIGSAVDATSHDVDTAVNWAESNVSKAAGWTVSELRKIPSAVYHFVVKGLDGIHDLIFRTVGLVHHLVSIAFAHLHQVAGWAHDALNAFHGMVTWTVGQIGHQVAAFNTDIVQPAVHTLENGIKAAEAEAKAGIHSLVGVVHVVTTDVEDALKTTIHDVETGARLFTTEAIATLEHDVVDPIAHDLTALTAKVEGLAATFGPDVLAAIDAVAKAGEWIILMGEYTIEDLNALLTTEIGGFGFKEAVAAAKATSTHADPVEAGFKTFLGG